MISLAAARLGHTFGASFRSNPPSCRFAPAIRGIREATMSETQKEPGIHKVAVAQMTSVGDTSANFHTCQSLVHQAVDAKCSMVFLPECFSFIGRIKKESLSIAETCDGPIMERYKSLARDAKIWLSLGGFQEKGPDENHLHNCHVVIDDTGAIVSKYRKVHLFDVDVPGGMKVVESDFTSPGSDLVVCNSPVGCLGLSVCYDLRFPELYQQLTFKMGAEVLLVPSAFTRPTGEAHWEVLLRARAIDCQCYVIAAAQAGVHNENRETYGHSMIVDPWGKIIGKLDDPHETGIAIADIDLGKMQDIRRRMPVKAHREAGHVAIQ
ncbi:hypothetical protein BSKO_01338 [Bryopsis sp. KO-2023]|nr:hypothetical protein BSKO_01338 [Bryopsis sp. KO-2023]